MHRLARGIRRLQDYQHRLRIQVARLAPIVVLAAFTAAAPAAAQGTSTVTISQPPATASAGVTLTITETVWNAGTGASGGGSQTLLLVPAGGGAAVTLGTRSIPALQAGGLSTVTTTVTIPSGTAAGVYAIGAGPAGCGANCLKSVGTVTISASNPTYPLALQINTPNPAAGSIVVANATTGAPFTTCTSSCTVAIPAGTSTRLIYVSGQTSGFQGWTAGGNTGCVGQAPCTFTMSGPKSVVATIAGPAGGAGTVTLTVYVSGPGSVNGGRENAYFQNQYFQNCRPSGNAGCVTSGPAGSAFVLQANTVSVPANGPFGKPRTSSFRGWSCNGTRQGQTGLRVVANANMTCTASFQ